MFVRSAWRRWALERTVSKTGTLLVRDFGADVLLLDDGFQHQRLARRVDVVLIDALTRLAAARFFRWVACARPRRAWRGRT